MDDEYVMIWKQMVIAYRRYCPIIHLEGLRKTTTE
jgi:hypothetical protein